MDVAGANYPVETNVTGLVHVSMGPGSYSVKIEPRKITGLTVNVCCVGGPAGLYNCVNGSVLRVELDDCRPGGIVVVVASHVPTRLFEHDIIMLKNGRIVFRGVKLRLLEDLVVVNTGSKTILVNLLLE